MGQLDWNAIGTLTGLAVALIAIISLIVQTRQASKLAQIALITQLQERYSSDEFLELRSEASRILLQEENPGRMHNALDHILSFYEFVGLLKRENVISDFIIWHSFSNGMFYYMAAARDYILSEHKRNRAIYADFILLHKKMCDVEAREAGADSPDLHISQDDVREFLEDEAKVYAKQKRKRITS